MVTQQPLLPVEILEYIFEDLHSNDFEGLKVCSLASRVFLRLARTYLFRDVTISVAPEGPTATADSLPTSPNTTTPTFLSFLASDRYAASNIRALQIQNARSSVSLAERRWGTTVNLLTQFHLKLTSIRNLSIHSSLISDWTLEDGDLRLAIARFRELPTLRDLQLYYVTISRTNLLDLVRISKLTLVSVRVVPEYPLVAPQSANPASTTENTSMTILQHLSIVLWDYERAEDVYIVVPAASKTLKSLRWVASPYFYAQDTYLHLIDLQAFISLTFLAISFPLDGEISLTNLATLFKRHAGRSALKVVEILCDYNEDPQRLPGDTFLNSSPSWPILDQTLISTAYSALENVRIGAKERIRYGQSLKTSKSQQDIRSNNALVLFQRHLPLTHLRGLIVGYKEAPSNPGK